MLFRITKKDTLSDAQQAKLLGPVCVGSFFCALYIALDMKVVEELYIFLGIHLLFDHMDEVFWGLFGFFGDEFKGVG